MLSTPIRRLTSLCAALLVLAGCQQILPIGGPAERTYALRFDGGAPGPKDDAPLVFLDDPLMAEGLGGQSLTVVLPGGERTALRNMRWSTDLASLLRDYMDRSLMTGTIADYVGEGALDVPTICRLQTKVWAFELRPGDSADEDRVHVWIEASLVRLANGELIAREQLLAERGLQGDDPTDVVSSLKMALGETVDGIADFMTVHLGECD